MIEASTENDFREPDHPSPAMVQDDVYLTAWWLHPAILFALIVLGTLLPALAMSSNAYANYDTPKYLDADSLKLGLIACLAVACGVYVGVNTGAIPRRMSPRVRSALLSWFYLSCALTIFGYAVWTANGLRNGLSADHIVKLLVDPDAESSSELKFEVLKTVPGVTTCTQFGLIAVVLGSILGRRKSRFVVPLIAAILLLSAVRMFLFSERLALIEVVVAMALAWLRLRVLSRRATRRTQFALSALPIVGVVTLILLFGGAEYLRSWKYYKNEVDSLVDFTLMRFFGYYSTSHNNGAMAWRMEGSMPLPYFTLQSFWHFPLLDKTDLSYEMVAGVEPIEAYTNFLNRYGSPEFNNPGGLFSPTLDYGVIGGLVFWLVFGFLAGRMYRSYLAGALAGLLFYPIFVICILEMPRFIYLCTVRPFAPLARTFLVLYCVSQRDGVVHGH